MVGHGVAELGESIPVHLAHDQHIDVAPDIVNRRGEGSKDHAEENSAHVRESVRDEQRDATLPAHEPADGSEPVVFGVDRPQSEVSDASTCEGACLQEVV